MKKLLIIVVLFLAACGSGKDASTDSKDVKTRCMNGVSYYLFKEYYGNLGFGYMAPEFRRDGTIVTCNE